MKKVYFAGSIRGGRDDAALYGQIIAEISKSATVLTEHVGDPNLSGAGENKTEEYIFNRDVDWFRECDLVVAEVTQASLGVGYELGFAESIGRPVICLYREQEGKRLSAMIEGNNNFTIIKYQTLDELRNSELFARL